MTIRNMIRAALLGALAHAAFSKSEYHARMRQWRSSERWRLEGEDLHRAARSARRSS